MSIAAMSKIRILAPKRLQNDLLTLLQELEVIEVTDLYEDNLTLDPKLAADIDKRISQVEEDLKLVQTSIRILQESFRPKRSIIDQFASTRIPVAESTFTQVNQDPVPLLSLSEEVQDLEKRWAELGKIENQVRQELATLEPWLDLDLPLDQLTPTATCLPKLGMVSNRVYRNLVEELSVSDIPVYIEVINQGPSETYLFFLYNTNQGQEVAAVLAQYGFVEVRLPQDSGAVSDVYNGLLTNLEEIKEQAQQIQKELAQLNEQAILLYSLSDILANEKKKTEVCHRFGDTGYVLVLTGWCQYKDVARLTKAVHSLDSAIVVEEIEPEAGEEPPVALANRRLVEPFEVITVTAGVPKWGTPDPTPSLAPFFFIFFGMALGDAGYGIVLSLLALWLMKRTNAVGMGKQFLQVLAVCGLSTFIFGALTGSWFGDLLGLPPIWFNPVEDPLKMLILALALGLVHLFTGLGVAFAHNIRQGKIWDALFDQALWWLFIGGLALLLVAPSVNITIFGVGLAVIAKYLALGGAIGLVLTQGRQEKSVVKKLFKGLTSLMGVSNYLSDVLSYSRLLALGLATGVIGIVINDVSGRVSGIPLLGFLVVLVVLVIGHLFNLLINVVSAYVHTSRLQYVEFFGKCFEGGGKMFEPFAQRTKLVQVLADEEIQVDKTKGGA